MQKIFDERRVYMLQRLSKMENVVCVEPKGAFYVFVDINNFDHKHDYKTDKTPATCTTTGLSEGAKCKACEEIIVAQEIIPALGHTEETLAAKAATCTEAGLTEGKKCSVCGDVIVAQEEIAALGHTEKTLEGKAPTCTEPGLTEGKECSVCGEILAVQAEIITDGHKYEANVTEPTCEADGYTTYTCSVCGDSYVADETEALGHDWADATTEAPKTCKVCGATEGDKLPEDNTPDNTPDNDEPAGEKNHDECQAQSAWDRFMTLIINFFRSLFGLPEKCFCGEDL